MVLDISGLSKPRPRKLSALAAGGVQTHIILSVHADRQNMCMYTISSYKYFVHKRRTTRRRQVRRSLPALFIQPAEINAIMRKIKELIPKRRARAKVIFNLLAQTARGVNINLRFLYVIQWMASLLKLFIWTFGSNNLVFSRFCLREILR